MSEAGAPAEQYGMLSLSEIGANDAEGRIPFVAEHCRGSGKAMKSDVPLLMEASQRKVAGRGSVLAKPQFLVQLEREMRRADRSKAPLSIVRFDSSSANRSEGAVAEGMSELVKLLNKHRRETDVLGYLGHDAIGVLLLDTDALGAEQYMKRVSGQVADLAFTADTATYPHQIFNDLIAQDRDLQKFYVEEVGYFDHKGFHLAVKRMIDVVGALAGMVLLSPLLLVTALAVAVSSPGPIIFRQTRIGRHGSPFCFYKFRSMASNADDSVHRDYVTNLIQGNLETVNQGDAAKPVFKMKSDPRVTRIGRIIRKTSIDELPQLLNVLKGEMSLVGPRPPLPYEVEKYQSWHLRRVLEAKPGITGVWQVEGRSKVPFEDMVRMDLWYSRNWSLMLDLRILLKTVKVVFQCSGAD